jgi:hypothetical protein
MPGVVCNKNESAGPAGNRTRRSAHRGDDEPRQTSTAAPYVRAAGTDADVRGGWLDAPARLKGFG